MSVTPCEGKGWPTQEVVLVSPMLPQALRTEFHWLTLFQGEGRWLEGIPRGEWAESGRQGWYPALVPDLSLAPQALLARVCAAS